uniref:J domain-containing protein n=1 Tax=Trypanosoma congolense (strain IL3000) TaxID=1068625 RepID=G0UX68_TRYCI|nr:conserved hypothetical protein [Trypanosoma congolense IL3000]
MISDRELRNPDNWRLYHLLDLEPPVTAKQVQWLFRKVTLRHHFYRAYVILQDEERKSLYDSLGEDFVGYLNSGSWGPLIQFLGAKRTVYACCCMWGVILLLTLFLALNVAARADRYVMWTWMETVSPGFVAILLVLLATLSAMVASFMLKKPKEEGMRLVERIPAIGNFLAAFFYCIFAFVAVSIVDSHAPERYYNYTGLFVLPLLGDMIYYLSSFVWRWPRSLRSELNVGLQEPSPMLWYAPIVIASLHIILSIAQWIVIGQRVDQVIETSWYAVCVPIVLRAILRIVEAYVTSMSRRAIGTKTVLGVVFDTLCSLFSNGMLLTSVFFIAARFTRGRREVSTFAALIPVYLSLLYLIFSVGYTLLHLHKRTKENAHEERLNNLKWSPVDPQADSKVVPTLLRDFDTSERIIWDDINAGSSIQYSNGYEDDSLGTDGYGGYDSKADAKGEGYGEEDEYGEEEGYEEEGEYEEEEGYEEEDEYGEEEESGEEDEYGEDEELTETEERPLFPTESLVSASSAPPTAPVAPRSYPHSYQTSEPRFDVDQSLGTYETNRSVTRGRNTYRDPYEPKTETGLGTHRTPTEYTIYDTNNEAYEMMNTNLESECASSVTSSTFQTSDGLGTLNQDGNMR